MALDTRQPESDLWLPLPLEGEQLDPHTIHTHYFGFSVPEAALGAFLYVRYMPAFGLCQGGVCIFQGRENVQVTDMAYVDYEITMPWPAIDGAVMVGRSGALLSLRGAGHIAYDALVIARIDTLFPGLLPRRARVTGWRQRPDAAL